MRIQFVFLVGPRTAHPTVFETPCEPVAGDLFEFDGVELEAIHVVWVPGHTDYDCRVALALHPAIPASALPTYEQEKP